MNRRIILKRLWLTKVALIGNFEIFVMVRKAKNDDFLWCLQSWTLCVSFPRVISHCPFLSKRKFFCEIFADIKSKVCIFLLPYLWPHFGRAKPFFFFPSSLEWLPSFFWFFSAFFLFLQLWPTIEPFGLLLLLLSRGSDIRTSFLSSLLLFMCVGSFGKKRKRGLGVSQRRREGRERGAELRPKRLCSLCIADVLRSNSASSSQERALL